MLEINNSSANPNRINISNNELDILIDDERMQSDYYLGLQLSFDDEDTKSFIYGKVIGSNNSELVFSENGGRHFEIEEDFETREMDGRVWMDRRIISIYGDNPEENRILLMRILPELKRYVYNIENYFYIFNNPNNRNSVIVIKVAEFLQSRQFQKNEIPLTKRQSQMAGLNKKLESFKGDDNYRRLRNMRAYNGWFEENRRNLSKLIREATDKTLKEFLEGKMK